MQARLHAIKQRIAACEKQAGHAPNTVRLVAASKKQSLPIIIEAYEAGQRAFGENYLQEALPKIIALTDKSIEWHFIGSIQPNKTKKIAAHFDWVQSVDRLVIAQRLNDQRPTHLPPLNICIQVNIDDEKTKSGVDVIALTTLLDACLQLPRLKVRGIMTIPKPDHPDAFKHMALLWKTLQQQGYQLDTLSMGMSDDFELAIAEGSTMVRIGTALFGMRR